MAGVLHGIVSPLSAGGLACAPPKWHFKPRHQVSSAPPHHRRPAHALPSLGLTIPSTPESTSHASCSITDSSSHSHSMRLRGMRRDAVQDAAAVLESSSQLDESADVEEEEDDEALEQVDPEFYRIGYMRHARAYGVEFKEGPKGIGVYAAKDMTIAKAGRVIMEIPMELMVTVSKDLPWMFHPDIVPLGHPIFEIINSTNPETDGDLRLACLLLLALDQKENFWSEYSEYLPGQDEIASLLLATEDELLELHDDKLQQFISNLKQRAVEFWKLHWTAEAPLKVKRLAHHPSQFLWALGTVRSRKFQLRMTIGSKVQDALLLVPYAEMLNHSFQPTCSYRWRRADRMLEVVMNPRQVIKRGDEMTYRYVHAQDNATCMQYYGFSCLENPFDLVAFSGDAKIHKDSFFSAFNLSGLMSPEYGSGLDEDINKEADGSVLAAARTLPMWTDGDLSYLPTQEIRAAKELKLECKNILKAFPTTVDEDRRSLASSADRGPRWQAAVRYRINRKCTIHSFMRILDLYMERILY